MRLYHFTSVHLLGGIRKNGLTLGCLPIITETKTVLIRLCQWLTSDGDFNAQSWATSETISYDRTAVRLAIEIPVKYHDKLINAHDFVKLMPGASKRLITDWEGSENWYLFFGVIPPKWIKVVVWKKEVLPYDDNR